MNAVLSEACLHMAIIVTQLNKAFMFRIRTSFESRIFENKILLYMYTYQFAQFRAGSKQSTCREDMYPQLSAVLSYDAHFEEKYKVEF